MRNQSQTNRQIKTWRSGSFQPFVPYEELLSTLSSADVGIIINAVTNPNAAVGLLKRLLTSSAPDFP